MTYNGDIQSFKGIAGIYKILCLVNGRFYIGSTWNLHKRYKEHAAALKRGGHYSIHLQRAWEKYGKEAFVFEVIETCSLDVLLDREQHYLDLLKPYERDIGFNNSPTARSILGLKRSKESLVRQLTTRENKAPLRQIVSPQGQIYSFRFIAKFAREHGLNKVGVEQVLRGHTRYTKDGWRLPGAPIPEYVLLGPDKGDIRIPFGGLNQFCKRERLGYVSMRKLVSGKINEYRGMTRRGDIINAS